MNQLTTAFVLIVNHIAAGDFACDQETSIRQLFDEGLSDAEFEIALTALEATYHVPFAESLWQDQFEDFADLSLEEFLGKYLLDQPLPDALYLTNRLLDLRDTILEEADMEESPPEDEEDQY